MDSKGSFCTMLPRKSSKTASQSKFWTTAPCKSLRNSSARQLWHDSSKQKLKKWVRKATCARELHAAKRTDWFDCAQHSSDCAQDLCHYLRAQRSILEIPIDITPWGIALQVNSCLTVPNHSSKNSFERQLLHNASMQELKKLFRSASFEQQFYTNA